MHILLLSRYSQLGASTRLRFLQYIPYLTTVGLCVDHQALLNDKYLYDLYSNNSIKKYILPAYFYRLIHLLKLSRYKLIWIEKELFPYFPAIFERFLHHLKIPYVVDFDDAIFHMYDQNQNHFVRFLFGKKIDFVMKCSTVVVAGNNYLADQAVRAGSSNVVLIPTVVDFDRYRDVYRNRSIEETTIKVGWIGIPKTIHYLLELAPLFKTLQSRFKLEFVAIGANPTDVSNSVIHALPWSEASEVELLSQLDIGLMPLPNGLWERGKCGYKLIQYMACGKAVIASPVGVNNEIVSHGVNGLLASGLDQWQNALEQLILDVDLRKRLGNAARTTVEEKYTLQVQAPLLLEVLKSASEIK